MGSWGSCCVPARAGEYPVAMFAVVWHFWIAVVLMALAVAPVVALVVVGYLNKVVKPKYPGSDQPRG